MSPTLGMTATGKPIFADGSQTAEYTPLDHLDAKAAHEAAAAGSTDPAARHHHEEQLTVHSDAWDAGVHGAHADAVRDTDSWGLT